MSNAGGVVRLICGGIGAGKTYLTVKNAEHAKTLNKYNKIYSNIRSHCVLAEGITLLPDDWRECESDSLVIIDEVQMHEKFSKHFSSRRDSEITDLTMIRHKRLDIWMISPSPNLVNSDVRNLVNQYFYLEAVGTKTAKCFCFDRVKNNINPAIKKSAYDNYTFTIEEQYYSLYESTEDGKPSGRNYNVNIKLIGFIVGLIIVLCLAGLLSTWLFRNAGNQVDELTKAEKKQNQETKTDLMPKVSIGQMTGDECRKGENVEKPECVEYYKNLSQSGRSVGVSVAYDPTKPYDIKLPDDYQVQVVSYPKATGAITKSNGQCVTIDQRGNYMEGVSQSDCKRLLSGHVPFDYTVNDTYRPQDSSIASGFGQTDQQAQIQPQQQAMIQQQPIQQPVTDQKSEREKFLSGSSIFARS